jgi:hypothetical protein
LISSGCSLVIVDHAGEDPSSPYRGVDRDDDGRVMVRWALGKTLMWTVSVEVRRVLVEDRAGVTLVVDQDSVRTLLPDAADEPFRATVRPRSSWRGLDHVDTFCGGHRIAPGKATEPAERPNHDQIQQPNSHEPIMR